ncbi:MAG: hypothetical protein JRE65_07510 [Deltaproteobacteria bacterium]|jgi:hypothetical protein|nr:hypothetical protein [Deltaproteobacteria bacterium]
MNKKYMILLLFSILICTAQADTLVLKNGLSLEGKFKGGDETTIKFETSGAIQEVAIAEIKSLTFSVSEPETQTSSQATPSASTAAAATAAPAASGTEIPAGTKLMIKTSEDVSTASHKAGAMFKCVLEADLIVNGSMVAPKGSEIYGKVLESIGGRRIGNQRIVVSFDKISINGQLVAMDTDEVGAEGGRGGAARAVGAGALIGAAAGDAGAGAAVGAGLALLAGGKHIQVPAGTVVEVAIKQAIKVP